MRKFRTGVTLTAALVVPQMLPAGASAQPLRGSSFGVSGVAAVARLAEPRPGSAPLDGIGFGAEATLAVARIEITGRYTAVSLEPDRGGEGRKRLDPIDLVEVEWSVGTRVLPWWRLDAGGTVQQTSLPSGPSRRLRWGVGSAAAVPLYRDIVLATGRLFVTAPRRASFADDRMSWGGTGAVALEFRAPAAPGWAAIGYHASTDAIGTVSSPSVRRLAVTVGFRVP